MAHATAFDTHTLPELIGALAARAGDAVALHSAGKTLTFRELDERSNQVAHALLSAPEHAAHEKSEQAATAESRRRVAVLGRDSADSLIILFGAAKAGMPVVFVNYRLAVPELEFILGDAAVSFLFVETSQAGAATKLREAGALAGVTSVSFGGLASFGPGLGAWSGNAPKTPPEERPSPDDVAVLLYTSGTTGRPKGVALPHRSFLAIRRELERAGEDWWGLTEREVALHTLPLFHIGGLWWAMNVLALGARLVMMPQFDADLALELIEAHGVTSACLVPAMMKLVLDRQAIARRNVRSLRTIAYGGAPIAPALLAAARDKFQPNLIQFYGLTETGNTAVCLRPSDHADLAARAGAAGLPYPGVALRLVNAEGQDCAPNEIGEVFIRSPANMLGYWRRPEATEETLRDGFVRTGDAGYRDADGYLYVCDRVKDMIISAGENIYPAEVEAALQEHPAVKEVAVIGVPDERWGEVVKAIVVRSGPLDARELLQSLRGRIAEFKFPRSVDFVEALPRTPSGKIKKHELRAPYWAGRSRKVN